MISKSSNISAKDYELFLNYSKELGLDRTMVHSSWGKYPRSRTAIQCGLRPCKWLSTTGSSETMVAVSISKIKDALKNNKLFL